ncbi:MAG: MTH1187 family thiamine-binding protein [Azoarcus sp.]|nr:MTH1187 family thiamine-binding protein [Azoarcus sp.]|tara:strand:+ start:4179 stop:4499 length:321 start_codon:yes stop_codon:yes gene_type:complete
MQVIVDIAIVPIGVGNTLSPWVAACERVLREAGLEPVLHANGTNVEGDWDVVFGALRRCHETLHTMGAPRISTNIRLGTRTDRTQTMAEKITAVEAEMARKEPDPQ